jgi:predicted esterase
LKQFKTEGFKPENGYIYGFSYGAHLALHGSLKAYGNQSLGLIDGKVYYSNLNIYI